MSHKNLIVTLISDDKAGIVSHVAEMVAAHQGNWLDSHMVQLAGKFTGILRIDVPEQHIEPLSNALKSLTAEGIETLIEQECPLIEPTDNIIDFELSGSDRTGIVSEIAKALSEQGISIDKIQTHCSSTPWSGEPLFEAKGRLLVPSELSVEALQDKFHTIEDSLGIDITFLEKSA